VAGIGYIPEVVGDAALKHQQRLSVGIIYPGKEILKWSLYEP
jgi:hypothetical protein